MLTDPMHLNSYGLIGKFVAHFIGVGVVTISAKPEAQKFVDLGSNGFFWLTWEDWIRVVGVFYLILLSINLLTPMVKSITSFVIDKYLIVKQFLNRKS